MLKFLMGGRLTNVLRQLVVYVEGVCKFLILLYRKVRVPVRDHRL